MLGILTNPRSKAKIYQLLTYTECVQINKFHPFSSKKKKLMFVYKNILKYVTEHLLDM